MAGQTAHAIECYAAFQRNGVLTRATVLKKLGCTDSPLGHTAAIFGSLAESSHGRSHQLGLLTGRVMASPKCLAISPNQLDTMLGHC